MLFVPMIGINNKMADLLKLIKKTVNNKNFSHKKRKNILNNVIFYKDRNNKRIHIVFIKFK